MRAKTMKAFADPAKAVCCAVIASVALGLSAADARAQAAKDYNCVVLSVTQLTDRIEVSCGQPGPTRGDYPADTGYLIQSFAVPLTNADFAGRFAQLANLAMTAGIPMWLRYISGDYGGESYGCDRKVCRTPVGFALVKGAIVP